MKNTNMNNESSEKSLVKATVTALILAAVMLILFILPAEYNIDPTGIGAKLGLTVLALPEKEEKVEPQLVNSEIKNETGLTVSEQKDTVEVTVPAGRGIEYKFQLSKNQTMTYEWKTDGVELYLDLHGEPAGDTTGYYESYTIATASEMSGQFTTPFAGVHGWYWKNKTEQDIKVTLTTQGPYEVVGLKK
jgi:hypothetical protein